MQGGTYCLEGGGLFVGSFSGFEGEEGFIGGESKKKD